MKLNDEMQQELRFYAKNFINQHTRTCNIIFIYKPSSRIVSGIKK